MAIIRRLRSTVVSGKFFKIKELPWKNVELAETIAGDNIAKIKSYESIRVGGLFIVDGWMQLKLRGRWIIGESKLHGVP